MKTLIKQPGESRAYEIDFSNLLAVGETIASVDSVTATPTGLTVSGIVFSGTKAQFRLADGTVGQMYKVTAVVTATGGDVLEGGGNLDVREL